MSTTFTIRHPEEGDIEGIRAVVKACEPLIMTYIPYYYWIATRYFFETCAVAERDGKIAGWCCILSVPNGKYFIHQLGVLPEARGHRVAQQMVSWLFKKLKSRGAAGIELTIERDNNHVKKLFGAAAQEAGLKLVELSEYSKVLDKEYNETLYVIKEAA